MGELKIGKWVVEIIESRFQAYWKKGLKPEGMDRLRVEWQKERDYKTSRHLRPEESIKMGVQKGSISGDDEVQVMSVGKDGRRQK